MASSTPPERHIWDDSILSERSSTASAADPRLTQSWPGPRTVNLQRCERGFGFTLRHFIVYPPDSLDSQTNAATAGFEGSDKSNVLPLEPMDTIFVKHVKDGSPAHRAGLNTGDRIVSVNGETIAGKSYSQVVQLIQRSGNILQLLVMPKEDDILQLYFPGTAYRSSPEIQQQQQPPPLLAVHSSASPAPSTSSSGSIPPQFPSAGKQPALHSLFASSINAATSAAKMDAASAAQKPATTTTSRPVDPLTRRRFSEFPTAGVCRAEVSSTVQPVRGVACVLPLGGGSGSSWSVASVGLGLGLGAMGMGLGGEVATPAAKTDRSKSTFDLSPAVSSTTMTDTPIGTRLPQQVAACPPAREYSTTQRPSVSQDFSDATPPSLSLSADSSREPSIERRGDLNDHIINRLKASFEKKEEFLLRSTPSLSSSTGPRWPSSDSQRTFYSYPKRLPDNNATWPPPHLLGAEASANGGRGRWPSLDGDVEHRSDSADATLQGSTASSLASSPSHVTSSSSLQALHFLYGPTATSTTTTTASRNPPSNSLLANRSASDAEEPSEEASSFGHPTKNFGSSLTRIQENIPSSSDSEGRTDRRPFSASAVPHPWKGSGRPEGLSHLRGSLLRKASSLDSDLLPASRLPQVTAAPGTGSAGSIDEADPSGIHLVSHRARLFEMGALEQEANNRMNLYRNELARLTTRGQTPRVSDRAAQFESLSTSQETIGSDSDYGSSPRQRATVDLRKESTLARLRSYSDNLPGKNAVSSALLAVTGTTTTLTTSTAFAPLFTVDALRMHPSSLERQQDSAKSQSDPSFLDGDDEESNRHRATRQNSYLAAVKSSYKDHNGSSPGNDVTASTQLHVGGGMHHHHHSHSRRHFHYHNHHHHHHRGNNHHQSRQYHHHHRHSDVSNGHYRSRAAPTSLPLNGVRSPFPVAGFDSMSAPVSPAADGSAVNGDPLVLFGGSPSFAYPPSVTWTSPKVNCMTSTTVHSNQYNGMLTGPLLDNGLSSRAVNVQMRRKAIYEDKEEEGYAVRRVSYLRATSEQGVTSASLPDGVAEADNTANGKLEEDLVNYASRIRPSTQQLEVQSPSQATRQQPIDATKSATPIGSRSQSIQKLKAFFGERTPQIVEASERRPFREFSPNTTQTLLSGPTAKDGWLNCKVSVIEGKRATDRSWRQLWTQLKSSSLHLYRDKKDAGTQTSSLVDELSIDLTGCQVDVASDYTKKKHVFRLSTSAGSEYLFQAECHSDMQHWIRHIQDCLDLNGKGAITQGIVMRKSALFERELGRLSPPPGPKGIRKLTTFRNRSPTGHSPTSKTRKSSQGDNTSPKSKTWRGKMVKTIRKIHGISPTSAGQAGGVTIGVPLDECPTSSTNEFVPLLIDLCTSIVEARGLEVIGIYRVPGNTAAVSFLLDAVNHGFESLNLQDPKWNDVNVISSLLKAFFRKLPEPLVTCELYPLFIEASKIEDMVQRMYALKKMLHELPDHNYETLKFLIRHLQKIVAHSHINKMEARNLAIVFGPTLVRAADDNIVKMVTDMSYQCRIVEIFISHADWFFSTNENEDIANCNFPLNNRATESPEKPISNQNLLLNNVQKMEHAQSEMKMKDVSAKDLVSSIIGAANRKVRQKMRKPVHHSQEEPEVEERDIDREIELRMRQHTGSARPHPALRASAPDGGCESKPVTGGGAAQPRTERRHSEDSSTSSLSTRTVSEDYAASPRKMSVDSLDSLQPSGSSPRVPVGVSASGERGFCLVRQSVVAAATSKRPTGPIAEVSPYQPPADGDVLRTYAGLSDSMQERIRRFEQETKALLLQHRGGRRGEEHSADRTMDAERLDQHRQRIEAEWQRAKQDLEQDDFLDELADNPSAAQTISDITQKIRHLHDTHYGRWTAKTAAAVPPPSTTSMTDTTARLPSGTASAADKVTTLPTSAPIRHPALPPSAHPDMLNTKGGDRQTSPRRPERTLHSKGPPRVAAVAPITAMKRSGSVENFSPLRGVGESVKHPPAKHCVGIRRWTSPKDAICVGRPKEDLSPKRQPSAQTTLPTSKWCGSLDSLREYYQQQDCDTNGFVPCQRPQVPPYHPPPPAPLDPPAVPPHAHQSFGLGEVTDVSVQRNENTLITATLSTTHHTVSSTSTTAVITATIISRSSKATPITTSSLGTTSKPTSLLSRPAATTEASGVTRNGSVHKTRETSPPGGGGGGSRSKSSHLRNLKRRHTVGGTKDFEKFRLLIGNQLEDRGSGVEGGEGVSAWDQLRPAAGHEDGGMESRSIASWLRRERMRTSSPDIHGQVCSMLTQEQLRPTLATTAAAGAGMEIAPALERCGTNV